MSLTEKVTQKLDEYGIDIYNEYQIDGEEDYVFYAKNMIVFVNDSDNSISVTFKVTTKPERAATLALILNQIKESSMNIMEPFIFNEKNEFLSGEAAYQLLQNFNKTKLVEEVNKQQLYAQILDKAECYEC
jgi:hypothetical protein